MIIPFHRLLLWIIDGFLQWEYMKKNIRCQGGYVPRFYSRTAGGGLRRNRQGFLNLQPDYDNVTQARSGIQYDTGEMMPEGKSYDDCP
jgi:hypothetical protein